MKTLGVFAAVILFVIAFVAGLGVIIAWAWNLIASNFHPPLATLSFQGGVGIVVLLMIIGSFIRTPTAKS